MKYTPKPLAPVDAVLWRGDNLEEVLALCPEATVPSYDAPAVLYLPSNISVMPGEYVIDDDAGVYSKMSAEIFLTLYKTAAK